MDVSCSCRHADDKQSWLKRSIERLHVSAELSNMHETIFGLPQAWPTCWLSLNEAMGEWRHHYHLHHRRRVDSESDRCNTEDTLQSADNNVHRESAGSITAGWPGHLLMWNITFSRSWLFFLQVVLMGYTVCIYVFPQSHHVYVHIVSPDSCSQLELSNKVSHQNMEISCIYLQNKFDYGASNYFFIYCVSLIISLIGKTFEKFESSPALLLFCECSWI